MFRVIILCCLLCFASPVRACDIALLLALDVSGSVDPAEYALQRDGLALALRDGLVSEALVRAGAKVAVMQWTGSTRQRITVPWTRIASFDDADRFADQVQSDVRVWRNFSTAIGDALELGAQYFDEVPDCKRKVIDVSGDGRSNEGLEPHGVKPALKAQGITVNGLVIEASEDDLTAYYWENVITGEGAFVVTAADFRDYPARIREKLLREIVPQVSDSGGSAPTYADFVITR